MSISESPRPPLDEELAQVLRALQTDGAASVTSEMIPLMREFAATVEPADAQLAEAGEVVITDAHAQASDGTPLPLLILRPADLHSTSAPAILFVHGGGMVMGSPRTGIEVPLAWAREFGAVVVSIGYRLAPEHPAPTPVEDCYAGLTWLHENAREVGIDPARIVIAGASAGGGLAAGVALLSRDRGGPALLGQVLMSPMLDDRNESPSSFETGDSVWDRTSNETGWAALLGTSVGTDAVSPYSAPSRARDLSGLPQAFIDAGSAELFRDEDVDYAVRLWRAGTQAELHIWPGAFHSFDTIAPGAELSLRAIQTRAAWVGRTLRGE